MSQALAVSITAERDRDVLPNTPQLKARGSQRQPELDALRGLMLIFMTLAHLPTQAQVITNQQLGFISEAEGFIFLSAFLTGRIFECIANESGFSAVIKRLWTRALRLYGYHLFLLGIAFTVVATVAIHTKRPGLEGLLDFYLAHPIHAVCSAVLLVYCPPLLDILPMYMIFLVATPIALYVGSRWSWKLVLIPSGFLWALAQFGLRTAIYAHMVQITGLQIPLNEMGAFDLLGWQFLWIAGLWIGAGRPENIFKSADIEDECNCSATCGRCVLVAPPPDLERPVRWGALGRTYRQMASGRLAAAGLFVRCYSLCRQQALAGALVYDLSASLARQSIAGGVLCASAVLLRCAFFCKEPNRFARMDTGGFYRRHTDWSLHGG
jgi:hypothetical protein